ncbi:hypothetical protein [Modestobacter sp. VKM Ac-2978]|uniref:hypothetical protein n=1 Tax=Modestobacter sp. VKM Ac-2978 TaxID=3004132 RepID=UPI0022AAA7AE|nr:hypothetical protein [Modestobacter sp. VKM Ac-2978]MCZ2849391.1 hypothetical protein [Modestobacter sp. VKM Ac-2978]
MTSPAELAVQHTLRTAVARYDDLRARDSLADPSAEDSVAAEHLTQPEALELLALSQVITRKASYGQQLAVRSARETGASWAAIGRALDMTKQAAWEAHTRWIEDQAVQHRDTGVSGLDDLSVARARKLAGRPDDQL